MENKEDTKVTKNKGNKWFIIIIVVLVITILTIFSIPRKHVVNNGEMIIYKATIWEYREYDSEEQVTDGYMVKKEFRLFGIKLYSGEEFVSNYGPLEKKPILYLYPTSTTKVTVNFEKENNLTTTYPKFNKEWTVTANPNGDLYDENGNYYYGLYWEEKVKEKVNFDEGFYVEKEDAISFLEEKLEYIGLNAKERNEFIMYWLPILESNEKSLVYFELTNERENFNKIQISPKPDSLLRIAMHVKKVNEKVEIKEQKLTKFNRTGFTAVEWGGIDYND